MSTKGPVFSRFSRENLSTCDARLQQVARRALLVGMDFRVLAGFRGEAEQNLAYERGASKVRWPNSKHNTIVDGEPCSQAMDIAPWPIDWKNTKRFYHLAGIIRAVAFELMIPIRWGGDWDRDFDLDDQSFFDLGHFEIGG